MLGRLPKYAYSEFQPFPKKGTRASNEEKLCAGGRGPLTGIIGKVLINGPPTPPGSPWGVFTKIKRWKFGKKLLSSWGSRKRKKRQGDPGFSADTRNLIKLLGLLGFFSLFWVGAECCMKAVGRGPASKRIQGKTSHWEGGVPSFFPTGGTS